MTSPRHCLDSLLLAAALLLAACSSGSGQPSARSASSYDGPYPYKVTATTGMVADIIRNVAGEHAAVTQVIGEGVDPHLYNPNRSDVEALMAADVVFYSGLLLEGRMTDVLMRMARHKPVYAVTELIDEEYLLLHGGVPDPHVWMDVQGWMKATEAAAQALAEFDPRHAGDYQANAARHLEQLRALDEYVRGVIASIPQEQRLMITAHDAFSYMGRAYGLEVRGIQGLSTESEAGLQDINRLVDLIVERRVPAIFVETSVSDKNVKALIEGARSRGHQVRVGGTLFSDAMGPRGTYEGTYAGMIDHNATTIARALGGAAPQRGMQGRLAVIAGGETGGS